MQNIAAKISDSELEVLEVLWEAEEALPIAPIRKRLEERRGWDSSTIKTLLRRLCEKGAVEARRRESFDYQRWSTRSLIQRVYRGSAKDLVASLVRGDQLTDQDLDELRALLDREGSHG